MHLKYNCVSLVIQYIGHKNKITGMTWNTRPFPLFKYYKINNQSQRDERQTWEGILAGEIEKGRYRLFILANRQRPNLSEWTACILSFLFWGAYQAMFRFTPGSVRRDHFWQCWGDQMGLAAMQGKHPTCCTLSQAFNCWFWIQDLREFP